MPGRRRARHHRDVDATDDLRRLPTAHAVALRMWRSGADPTTIADALGIDVDAVPGLIEVAERKLAAIRRAEGDPPAG
jgi:hypothetical protein